MSGKQIALIGCALVFIIGILVVVLAVGFFMHMSKDLEGAAVSVDGPIDVQVGDTFDLVVTVRNERPGKPIRLSDIDFSEGYLAGFTVVSTDPIPKSTMHNAIVDTRSFTFNADIPPGGSAAFSFSLRAERPGVFRGDVDVYEGMRCTTNMAQTSVIARE